MTFENFWVQFEFLSETLDGLWCCLPLPPPTTRCVADLVWDLFSCCVEPGADLVHSHSCMLVSPDHSDSAKTHEIAPLLSDKNTVMKLSKKTAASVLASSPTPSPSSGRFVSSVRWLYHHLQPYSWLIGKRESISSRRRQCFPPHTGEFDLTNTWSGSDSDVIESDDILALAAAVYMFIKLHLSPQHRYPRSLPELLTAFAALPTSQQPGDVPVLHNAFTIQRVAHIGFRMVQQLGCELATLTSMAWVDIFRWRFALRQQRRPQGDSLIRLPPAVPTDSLAFLANQVAATHFQDVPFCLTSRASQVGVAAWFVSVLFGWRLSLFAWQRNPS